MSVLNYPRIYLNGHMFWNPPTGNNNDMYPLYDAVKTQLNWDFLKFYNITPENAGTRLMPWLIAPRTLHEAPDYVTQAPPNALNPGNLNPILIPGEWDLFGDNGCGTVNYGQIASTITGGELPGGGYVDQDSLITLPYNLYGNPFGSNTPTPARFVDISPWQNTFTALYFDRLVLGNEQCGLTANRQYRMLDRFLNFNWAGLGGLHYVTTTWQTCFPKENLTWTVGNSTLLKNLQEQMTQQNAQGLMFRFTTYLTFYDRNGVFNDQPYVNTRSTAPLDMAKLQDMYQKGLDNPGDIFFNPAYSSTAGVLGLWLKDEYPTAPSGPRLVPCTGVPLPGVEKPQKLGVISAQVHDNTLSLDLMNAFPFYPVDPNAPIPVAEKYNAGSYDIGVNQGGQFTSVASFTYADYEQAQFDKRSGLLDLAINADAQALLQKGPLELQLQGTTPVTASVQRRWTAEVIESGSFIDVNDTKTLQIMVQRDGKPAPAGTVLYVAEYNNAYLLGTSDYYLGFRNDVDFTLFYDFPLDRTLNHSNLPQFVDSPAVALQVSDGTGRKLTALREASATEDGTQVLYKKYLQTPAGVSLGSCLEFQNAQQGNRQLDDPLAAKVSYNYTQITTDADGIARVTITAKSPGFPTLRFFLEDGVQPADIPFSFTYTQGYVDFLAPLRVLPLEPEMQQAFITAWNAVYQQHDAGQAIWTSFIYPQILEPYYYLYPIMSKYMPLNSLSRIEGAVDQLIRLISKPYQEESTLAMPITRDMPQSRRAVLELWAQKLVKQNYPPFELSMDDYKDLSTN